MESPSPQIETSGPTDDAYFRRDAPGRISIKKSWSTCYLKCVWLLLVAGKQAPQRDFSQFSFRNAEPKIEGDDSSSIGRCVM